MFTSIGIDPGSKNCAFSVVSYTKSGTPTVIRSGIFEEIYQNFPKDPYLELNTFYNKLDLLIIEYNPKYISSERFQGRGLRGSLGEKINIMLGCTFTHLRLKHSHIKRGLFSASTWKNKINKTLNLKNCYKVTSVTPHQLDATLIAIYFVYIEKCSDCFQHLVKYEKLFADLELTSDIKTTNRRNKNLNCLHKIKGVYK